MSLRREASFTTVLSTVFVASQHDHESNISEQPSHRIIKGDGLREWRESLQQCHSNRDMLIPDSFYRQTSETRAKVTTRVQYSRASTLQNMCLPIVVQYKLQPLVAIWVRERRELAGPVQDVSDDLTSVSKGRFPAGARGDTPDSFPKSFLPFCAACRTCSPMRLRAPYRKRRIAPGAVPGVIRATLTGTRP